jgi:hypothetical protein
MKQSGGAGDEALVLDRIIRSMIRYVSGYLPYPLLNLGENVYPYMTILKRAEQIPGIGPYIDIGKEAFVQGTQTAIIGTQDAAKTVGGPAGAAVVAIPAAIGTMFIVATHVLEDELGEAFLVSFLAIPIIGPVLYKAAGSLGKFGRKLFEHKEAVVGTTRTFLGDDIGTKVEYYIPNMDARKEEESVQPTTVGAKRFSTRRRKTHKWRRARSVRR